MTSSALKFSTLHLNGTITLANGETRAAVARRPSNEPDVVVTYVAAKSDGRTLRRSSRIASSRQAATFVAYAWRGYLSAADVHAEALAEDSSGKV